jgi:hypothetical protein
VIDARSIKLIAQLSSENEYERAAAMSVIDRGLFVDVAMQLDAIADAERRTGHSFDEIIKIVQKRWPKREPGWRGLPETKKFLLHRLLVGQHWLSEYEKRRLTELNDQLCLAPGNESAPADIQFLDEIMRRAEREGLRI